MNDNNSRDDADALGQAVSLNAARQARRLMQALVYEYYDEEAAEVRADEMTEAVIERLGLPDTDFAWLINIAVTVAEAFEAQQDNDDSTHEDVSGQPRTSLRLVGPDATLVDLPSLRLRDAADEWLSYYNRVRQAFIDGADFARHNSGVSYEPHLVDGAHSPAREKTT